MIKFPNPLAALRRKAKPDKPVVAVHSDRDLWWVRIILNVGRPVVAVIVLVMCAPGEHYLARLAGWTHWLAWGMPATLTAYAGIAAVVATKRPKEAPGKKTAVAGAVISVVLAMGAQPIAHLYQQQLITGNRMLLTIIVSCIPALVFGHLLHMAAVPNEIKRGTPGVRPFDDDEIESARDTIADAFGVPRDMLGTDADMVRAHEIASDADYSPDAYTYRAGDNTGMDAGLDYLRGTETGDNWDGDTLRQNAQDMINRPRPESLGVPLDVSGVPDDVNGTPEIRSRVSSLPDTSVTFEGQLARVPRLSLVPHVVHVDGRDMSAGVPAQVSFDKDTTGHRDTGHDQGQTAVSRPVTVSRDTDTGDTVTGRDNPGSVPSRGNRVPVSRGRSGTGITSRVRDIIRDKPDVTDDQIKDMFDTDVSRNSIGKSIKRVRNES